MRVKITERVLAQLDIKQRRALARHVARDREHIMDSVLTHLGSR
ncbi:hypothetical protein [Halovibrio sp. HP20-50]|nr:hypothetical protein [Halovibrio sp. HP20-59]MEA2118125.1 hypothetical protein [Halovibrio sp. HP20-59]